MTPTDADRDMNTALKILRTNHPLVLDNIVWLREGIARALAAERRRALRKRLRGRAARGGKENG